MKGFLIDTFENVRIPIELTCWVTYKGNPDYEYMILKGITYDNAIGRRFQDGTAKYRGFPMLLEIETNGVRPVVYVSNYYAGKKVLHIRCRGITPLKYCERVVDWQDKLENEK